MIKIINKLNYFSVKKLGTKVKKLIDIEKRYPQLTLVGQNVGIHEVEKDAVSDKNSGMPNFMISKIGREGVWAVNCKTNGTYCIK